MNIVQGVPLWFQAFIAFVGSFTVIQGTLTAWWAYRLKSQALANERILMEHQAESRAMLSATVTAVAGAAQAGNDRDVRNVGAARAILSPVTVPMPAQVPSRGE